jgi:uncharacterized protein YycO
MRITLRAHHGVGVGSSLVRGWTRSHWGHVDLVFDAHDLVLDVRPKVGLALTPFYQAPLMGDAICRSFIVPDFIADPVFAEMNREQGSPYDWHGACAAGVPWLAREHKDAWFCSEAVWHAMHGLRLVPGLPAWRRTPADIADLILS